MWTKSLRWLGGELYLNAEANATSADGEVSVAVLTADGRERPGYGAADAVAFQGNSTNSVICRFTIVVFAAGQLSFSRFCCSASQISWFQVARWAVAKMEALTDETVVLEVRLRGGARLYSLRGNFIAVHANVKLKTELQSRAERSAGGCGACRGACASCRARCRRRREGGRSRDGKELCVVVVVLAVAVAGMLAYFATTML